MRGGRGVEEDKESEEEEEEEEEEAAEGDRPEFVQLGESVSSGITSQNEQTQTEERRWR